MNSPAKKIKLYSIYTDEARELKSIFLKSIKDDWEVNIAYWGKAGEGGGDFATAGYIAILKRRIEYLVGVIKKNWGKVIIWSDIDIQFFGKCDGLVKEAIDGKDIVFLSEHWPEKEINGGFAVMRCGIKTLSFFETVLKTDFENLKYYDQSAMNNILREGALGIKWDILPRQFWAMSHGKMPEHIVLHHANCTAPRIINGRTVGSIELKIRQLREVRK